MRVRRQTAPLKPGQDPIRMDVSGVDRGDNLLRFEHRGVCARFLGNLDSVRRIALDQLFFQIHGEKRFRYAPNGYVENPDVQFSPYSAAQPEWGQTYRRGFPLTSEEVLARDVRSVTLRPGSAFFMPAGTWHTTAEQTEPALSLVVAVRAPSRIELLVNLRRY